jgi:hypothetical protein
LRTGDNHTLADVITSLLPDPDGNKERGKLYHVVDNILFEDAASASVMAERLRKPIHLYTKYT